MADGGTLKWAVDDLPETLNTYQADADTGTTRVAQATLPAMFRLDATGRPVVNPASLESAKVIETDPRQVVLYRLNQQAVWSDGREIGPADFVAQWRALSGKDSAYWTARNAGYDRIEKIERVGDKVFAFSGSFSGALSPWYSMRVESLPAQFVPYNCHSSGTLPISFRYPLLSAARLPAIATTRLFSRTGISPSDRQSNASIRIIGHVTPTVRR